MTSHRDYVHEAIVIDISEALCTNAWGLCAVKRPWVERVRPSDATSSELSHGTCIQPGPVDVRPSLCRSPLGTSPKSGRLVEHWVDNRRSPPELAPTYVLKMYARRLIWMWLSQRAPPNPGELSELAQIFNSPNSAGPPSKWDLSIGHQGSYSTVECARFLAVLGEIIFA